MYKKGRWRVETPNLIVCNNLSLFGQCNCCVIFTSLTTIHSLYALVYTHLFSFLQPHYQSTISLFQQWILNHTCVCACAHAWVCACQHTCASFIMLLTSYSVHVKMYACLPSPPPPPPTHPNSTPAPLWIIIHSNFTVYPSHMAKPSSPFLVLSYNLPCVAPFQTELCIVCMFLHPSILGLSQRWTWHQLPSAQGIDNLQEEHKWLTGSYVRAAQNQTHSLET